MSPKRNAVLPTKDGKLADSDGVAGVSTTGHVGRADVRQNGGIECETIVAFEFAEVAVEIDPMQSQLSSTQLRLINSAMISERLKSSRCFLISE